jgi:MFS family permease
MRRKSFLRVFFEAFGYACLGNILGLVVTVSLAHFGTFMSVVAAGCAILLYMMMAVNVGHKDGELERKLVRRKVIENPEPNRWIIIGIIIWLIMCVPCIMLIIMPENMMYLQIFRFGMGAVFALSILLGEELSTIPLWAPYLFIGIYGLTPVMYRWGFYVGYYEKMTIDSIVYKKQNQRK